MACRASYQVAKMDACRNPPGTLLRIPASGFIRVTGQGSRSKEISKSDAQGKSRLISVWICARLESARSCEHGFCSESGQATRWLEAPITDLFDEASGGQYSREMISLSAEAGLPVHAMSPSQHQSARCARANHRAASAGFRELGVSLPPKRHHRSTFRHRITSAANLRASVVHYWSASIVLGALIVQRGVPLSHHPRRYGAHFAFSACPCSGWHLGFTMNEPHAIDADYVSFEGINPGY